MQFRKFGKLDWHVSALGFGCMRLPTTDGDSNSEKIDENESVRLIRYGIDQGINYIDTAYIYHGGNSEIVTGKALKDGYRDKVKLATKLPLWSVKQTEDFDKLLNEQLKKLQTDHIDFYLFHALNHQIWHEVVLKLNLLEKAEAALQEGKIGYIGFSFHDGYYSFPEIIDGYDKWTFCQIQYNYMDVESQAGIKGLRYAASKGLAVVVMEPLLGGKLANPPKPIREVFEGFSEKRTPADWALQWVWDQPEVALLLSGMNTLNQLSENIDSANKSKINSLGAKELQLIDSVREKFRERSAVPCTRCGYCMPCPNGVSIPRIFELYNEGYIYEDLKNARTSYTRFFTETERANLCIQCRICEEKCPQKIVISEWMTKAHAVLSGDKEY